jgi:hypothetical protein
MLAWNSPSSCLSFLSAGIKCVHCHTWLFSLLFINNIRKDRWFEKYGNKIPVSIFVLVLSENLWAVIGIRVQW